MSTTREALLSEGFQPIATRSVALPHHVWKAKLEIEYDRRLRVVEEAILKLVAAGVGDPALLQRLLGLQGEPLVPRYVAEAMRNGYISVVEDRLTITATGRRMLADNQARERRSCDVEFRHDPYRDELLWDFDEGEVKDKGLDPEGLVALPRPDGLTHAGVCERLPDLQKMVERDGLPFEKKELSRGEKERRPEVLQVRPIKAYTAYRRAELEIWYREPSDEWRWRLLMAGGEVAEASAKLQQMEADGQLILPVEDRERIKAGPNEEAIEAAIREVSCLAVPVLLETADHRPALRQAVEEATRSLIIISPWIRTAAVDREMLDWFGKAMDRNKDLRITIGYGIDEDDHPDKRGTKTRKAKEQEEAIARLHKLSHQFRGRLRLIKIGNTHEKIVVVDEQYAIVTSFNWLSFNPQPAKVVRRETGSRLSEPAQVRELRARLTAILESSAPT